MRNSIHAPRASSCAAPAPRECTKLRRKPQKPQKAQMAQMAQMARSKRLVFAVLAATVLVAGCRQDMHDVPRYEAFEASATVGDNRASRIPPVGTVPRGWLRDDEALYTGKVAGQLIDQFPFAIAHADLAP